MLAGQLVASFVLLFNILFLLTECDATGSASYANMNITGGYRAEKRLRDTLLNQDDYSVRERPVELSYYPVWVNMSLGLYAFMGMEEKEQVFTGASWLSLKWTDYRLRWDPKDYGMLTSLSLDMDEIWTPKILLKNTASEKIENPVQRTVFTALASFQGVISLQGPLIHKTSCPMDLSLFPFDKQNCSMLFSTQNFPNCSLVLKLEDVNNMLSEISSQWQPLGLEGREFSYTFKLDDGASVTYDMIDITFSVKRLPNHHLLNVALPSGLLTLITICVFCLTIESGERVSMSVSLMLGQAVFWLVVADSLPPSGNQGVPLLLKYIEVNFVIGGLAILLSVVSVSARHQEGPIKSHMLRKVFLHYLPLMVCLPPRPYGSVEDSVHTKRACRVATIDVINDKSDKGYESTKSNADGILPPNYQGIVYSGDGVDQKADKDMKLVASVLDRIFLLTTLLIFMSGNILLLSRKL